VILKVQQFGKEGLLSNFIKISSIPIRLISHFFEYFKIDKIDVDLEKSLKIIDKYSLVNIDKKLIEVLIIAEDRRNDLHYGVDPIAILRAIKVRIFRKIYQGASTIEQQFVRVVSNRYERTFYRKFREQLLAIAVCKKRDKEKIAIAYLSIAYYGYNLEGLSGISNICGKNIQQIDLNNAIELVSRLKYPQPKNINNTWIKKHINRNKYILGKIKQN
jgi:membrane carboxypeptidase/penicillin-binding protein